ncbi:hypothetical protein EG349_18940 [Chryseobacterium shandongense]|uniref:Uncharacterized protein n=1 Tax=Chryseobacterium shandongense TaxID=1493872 RepID=A0AAD1DPG7_9FLAO|nr:hypothetical protein [Chryseobacterium shandongense]AZA88699.1 hypothetical protein EG349_18940 [Chryseobacterium shandongense]AZA97240.1 hypothetical protein EG353_17655 [Chryseobacterium shandongense]
MGSTGSGNFTDYEDFSGTSPKQGGLSTDNDCGKAFRTDLEDVDTSEYYKSNGKLPDVNMSIVIGFNGSRIVAMVADKAIGNLPTKYNYLRKCMSDITYSGIISNTSTLPINSVTINVSPDA